MTGVVSSLLVRRGTPEWDAVLRATGILALAAIYPALRWPDVAVLAGFLCLTLFVSGPISMVLPEVVGMKLSGTLREDCLRQERNAGAGGTRPSEPATAPPPQNPR